MKLPRIEIMAPFHLSSLSLPRGWSKLFYLLCCPHILSTFALSLALSFLLFFLLSRFFPLSFFGC
jgi:hypothetical protein